jgi:hypothetical protein
VRFFSAVDTVLSFANSLPNPAKTANMGGGGENSPIINEIVKNDNVPWYRKPNLRSLYLWLVPFAFFIESTSGFDSSMMNVRISLSCC